MSWRAALVLALLCGACSGAAPRGGEAPGTGAASAPASRPAPPATCAARALALKREMERIRFDHVGVTTQVKHVGLATAKKLVSRRVQVQIRADIASALGPAVLCEGAVVGRGRETHRAPLAPLVGQLQTMFRNWEITNPDRRLQRWVLLSIDELARWRTIRAVLVTLAAAGVDRVGFLFAVPDGLKKPGPTRIDRRLEQIRGAQDAAEYQRLIFGLIADVLHKPCPAVLANTKRVGRAHPFAKRMRLIIAAVVRGIVACSCAVDLPSVYKLYYAVYHQPPVGVVWRGLSRTSGAALVAAKHARWKEIYRRVVAGRGPILAR